MASVSTGRKISGPEKAAIFLLALGEERSIRLLEKMEEHEVRAIAARTATLGTVDAGVVERLFGEFGRRAQRASPPLAARCDTPKPAAAGTLWERMGDIPDAVLAELLAKEHPQTAAVVLSKIDSGHASRVLARCPKDFASDVIMRIARLGSVNQTILTALEQTLGAQLSAALNNGGSVPMRPAVAAPTARAPSHDLPEVGPDAIRALIGAVERDKLLLALKTASDEVRHRFFAALPERARAMLMEDLAALGPVRVTHANAGEAGAAWAGLRSRS